MEYNPSWAFSPLTRLLFSLQWLDRYRRNKGQMESYYRHRSSRMARSTKWRRQSRDTTKAYILQYLLSHPCIDCREDNPIVLEFDHRDRGSKNRNVSMMIAKNSSPKNVIAEIAKCDVRCANCHRIKTYHENGWTHKTPTTH